MWSLFCSLWTVHCFQASCINHCSNVQKLLALTTQPNVESKILFLAQYSCPYAKEVVGLQFTSLSFRCLKNINRFQSKLDHLKVNTYQLDRCIILTILNASVRMKRDFGYPVLIQTSKSSYFILEPVPTLDVQDFMDHPLFSSELIEGKATIYIATSSTQKCDLWLPFGRVRATVFVHGAYGLQHNYCFHFLSSKYLK